MMDSGRLFEVEMIKQELEEQKTVIDALKEENACILRIMNNLRITLDKLEKDITRIASYIG